MADLNRYEFPVGPLSIILLVTDVLSDGFVVQNIHTKIYLNKYKITFNNHLLIYYGNIFHIFIKNYQMAFWKHIKSLFCPKTVLKSGLLSHHFYSVAWNEQNWK